MEIWLYNSSNLAGMNCPFYDMEKHIIEPNYNHKCKGQCPQYYCSSSVYECKYYAILMYHTIVDKRQLPLNWVLISLLVSNRGTFVNAEYAICFKNRLRHLGYLGFKNHEARAPVAKWLEKWTCAQATQQVHFFRFIINLQRCLWNHFTHFRCNFTKEHNTIALFLVEIYVYWNSNRGINSIWKSV